METFNYINSKFKILTQHSIAGIELSNLLLAFATFFVIFLMRNFLKEIVKKKINFIFKLKNEKILKSIEKPLQFSVLSFGFFLSSFFLDNSGKLENLIYKVNLSLFTIVLFWIISQIIKPLLFRIKNIENILTSDLLDWIISALKILIFILGFSAVLELWGIKVGPIIAGLGLFGVAVALGAQDLFKNLISGILVLVEKRFKKGDVIEIENVIEGTVEKIGFRSTAIRKFDKSLCYIPNFQFAENAVVNVTETTYRRINWVIGLEYKSSVTLLKNICKDIETYIKNNNDFFVSESTPVIVKIDSFAASSIDILIRCFTNTNNYQDYITIKDSFAIEIKSIVEKRNGAFAFPSQSLYIEKQS
tara:strand:+ start:1282 stop:2364 length:1083 start_codon:yes stop_codon:yes gene_type:complete